MALLQIVFMYKYILIITILINSCTLGQLTWNLLGHDFGALIVSVYSKDDLLLAGGTRAVIFTSTDSGESWISAHENLEAPIRNFISTDSVILATGNYGVYRSTDVGVNWEKVYGHTSSFRSLAEDDRGDIYTSTNDLPSKIYRSTDSGESWDEFYISYDYSWLNIYWIESMNILMLTSGTFTGISSDYGTTWDTLSTTAIINAPWNGLKEIGEFLYVADMNHAYKSNDTGRTWIQLPKHDNSIETQYYSSIETDGQGNLLLGTQRNTIVKTSDDGEHWEIWNDRLYDSYITSIMTNANGTIFASGGNGVYKSFDSGQTWLSSNSSLNLPSVAHFHILGDNSVRLVTFSKVWKADSISGEWRQLSNGIYYDKYPTRYYSTPEGKEYLKVTDGLMQSDDNGESWSDIDAFRNKTIAGLVYLNNATYVLTGGSGLYKSTDNGEIWEQLPDDFSTYQLYDMVNIGDKIFVLTNNGKILVNSTFSTEWEVFNKNFPVTTGLMTGIEQSDLNTFVVSVYNTGVFLTTDNGESWGNITSGYNGQYLNKIFLSPGGNLFLSSNTGLFHYNKLLKKWSQISMAGVPTRRIHTVDFDGENNIYVGTDMGMYYSSLDPLTHIIPVAEVKPEDMQIKIYQNFPNPFNSSTKLSFEISDKGQIVFEVFGISGERVLHESEFIGEVGYHEKKINLRNNPSGVYIYRISQTSAGKSTFATGKMVYLK
ncbi:MAG: hypothetical protein SCALA702_01630 [Melioribacteraceae bacterium]|nr:MAG: hypothetical protein SCALA702_01630 [Melioribacteraceae bacterium]